MNREQFREEAVCAYGLDRRRVSLSRFWVPPVVKTWDSKGRVWYSVRLAWLEGRAWGPVSGIDGTGAWRELYHTRCEGAAEDARKKFARWLDDCNPQTTVAERAAMIICEGNWEMKR
jgi:hypothetical protein